jgi:hypothetical protein
MTVDNQAPHPAVVKLNQAQTSFNKEAKEFGEFAKAAGINAPSDFGSLTDQDMRNLANQSRISGSQQAIYNSLNLLSKSAHSLDSAGHAARQGDAGLTAQGADSVLANMAKENQIGINLTHLEFAEKSDVSAKVKYLTDELSKLPKSYANQTQNAQLLKARELVKTANSQASSIQDGTVQGTLTALSLLQKLGTAEDLINSLKAK